ncbi:hypothetical protein LIER_17076 [Lithospermum erythrorhizon]|uniref:Uncharacterized protein n=1 Tax=Lithospermum erythrorhizon TaxID=34254 RepID=A0AAV3QED6_LITER
MATPIPQYDSMAALRRQVDALFAKVAGQTRRGTNTELAGLAPFSPDIRGAIMLVVLKLPAFGSGGAHRGISVPYVLSPAGQQGVLQSLSDVIAFVEGLRMSKFKELLLKRQPQDIEEQRSPEPRRRRALDKIRAPDRAYSQTDLPRGSAFSRLQVDPRKRKEVKNGKIEYLTPLKTSAWNVFLEIEDRRLFPRPPRQKTSQIKRDMRG